MMMSGSFKSFRDNFVEFYKDKINFLHLHHVYILILTLITSALFYSQTNTKWNYIDALFLAASTATNTGLTTIDMSTLSHWQLAIMYATSLCGSHIIISVMVVLVRKHYFSHLFENVLLFNRCRRLSDTTTNCRTTFEKGTDSHNGGQPATKLRSRFSFLSMRASSNRDKNEEMNQMTYPPVTSSRYKIPNNTTRSKAQKRPHHQPLYSVTLHDPPVPRFHTTAKIDDSAITEPLEVHIKDVRSLTIRTTMDNSTSPLDRSGSLSSLTASSSTLSSTVNGDNSPQADLNKLSTLDIEEHNTATHFTAVQEETTKTPITPGSIMFADNVERQREIARQQFETGRQWDECFTTTTSHVDTPSTALEAEEKDVVGSVDKKWLTKEQRYRIGGAEYCAIDLLTRLVPAYYFVFTIGFGFLIRVYIASSSYAQEVLETSNSEGPVNAWVFSFFTSQSSFNNLGLIPIDASVAPFQSAPIFILMNMVLILAGNTAYALFLRLIIWVMYKLTPENQTIERETYRYLLDHPRRCYISLFPATQTKWLFIVLVAITAIEFASFIALNYWLPVLEGIDWGARILDGLFQSVATRSAGYSIVDLMNLNPGTQIIFVVAMYISVYPVTISMRNSNIYQEQALGIYQHDLDGLELPLHTRNGSIKRQPSLRSYVTSKFVKPDFFVMAQIQRQLTSEICWVICSIFAICVIETKMIMSHSPITVISIIFECVSAFGNVGASMGFPNSGLAQAGHYQWLSKLVLILLMLKGRNRGLPDSIDRAVLNLSYYGNE